MEKLSPRSRTRDTLSLKIGAWFEAQATGWGILAIPAVLLLALLAAAIKLLEVS